MRQRFCRRLAGKLPSSPETERILPLRPEGEMTLGVGEVATDMHQNDECGKM